MLCEAVGGVDLLGWLRASSTLDGLATGGGSIGVRGSTERHTKKLGQPPCCNLTLPQRPPLLSAFPRTYACLFPRSRPKTRGPSQLIRKLGPQARMVGPFCSARNLRRGEEGSSRRLRLDQGPAWPLPWELGPRPSWPGTSEALLILQAAPPCAAGRVRVLSSLRQQERKGFSQQSWALSPCLLCPVPPKDSEVPGSVRWLSRDGN